MQWHQESIHVGVFVSQKPGIKDTYNLAILMQEVYQLQGVHQLHL